MQKRHGVLVAASLALAGCVTTGDPATVVNDGFLTELPESVVAIAAPNQDLTAVMLMPEDGCYWYRHRGPVETTMLPLLTTAGRAICTRPQTGPFPAG
jgi:hypothetical protein